MCGRFTRDYTWAEVHAFLSILDLATPAEEPEPAFNISPTQRSWTLVDRAGGAEAREMRWGLVPSWAKDTRLAASMINARVETADSKPAFRAAWKSRRCLVPASGYYEWRLEGGIKQPYYIHSPDSALLVFAGLWETWREPGGEVVPTFAILTQEATGRLAALHDRAPLFLPAEACADWLGGSAGQAAAIAASVPMPALAWHPVARAVGNPRSQGRELTAPADAGLWPA